MPVTTSTIADLATNTADRVQNPDYIFWLEQQETYVALSEAISDLMLLIGRPKLIYNTQITLQPNTVWQSMPSSLICITSMRTDQYSLWKTTLRSLDYLQTSWGPDWESDISDDGPRRWAPLGWTKFIVHPAPSTPLLVNVAGIQSPIASWPPTGAEQSPFHSEFDVALQLYATAYLRLKELGDDALEGNDLFRQYLDQAQRLTTIEDRRDPLVFSRSFGAPTAPSRVSFR